jgi:hypothetical protein
MICCECCFKNKSNNFNTNLNYYFKTLKTKHQLHLLRLILMWMHPYTHIHIHVYIHSFPYIQIHIKTYTFIIGNTCTMDYRGERLMCPWHLVSIWKQGNLPNQVTHQVFNLGDSHCHQAKSKTNPIPLPFYNQSNSFVYAYNKDYKCLNI